MYEPMFYAENSNYSAGIFTEIIMNEEGVKFNGRIKLLEQGTERCVAEYNEFGFTASQREEIDSLVRCLDALGHDLENNNQENENPEDYAYEIIDRAIVDMVIDKDLFMTHNICRSHRSPIFLDYVAMDEVTDKFV